MNTTILKRLAATAACLGLMGAALPAMAADLGAEPYVAYAPAYNWTGFYIGGAVGVGSTNTEADLSAGGGLLGLNVDGLSGDGVHLAVLAGYNHQFVGSSIVAGIEGDVAWNDQNVDLSAAFGPLAASAEMEHDFSASIRGRLGYLVLERAMIYATAGLTYGEFDTTASLGGGNFSQDDDEWGVTVGGGIEVAATNTIRVRAEYLYTDYSTFDYPVGGGASFDMDPVNHTARTAVIWNW